MLYSTDWALVSIIDLEWTGCTVQDYLQNTSILHVCFRQYDEHNQPIFQALCVFYALEVCSRLVLVHIFHVPSKCTQAWWKMKLERKENLDLLELIHNAVKALVMVSSEAWDCSDMDNCIEAFSQSRAIVTREHSSTLLSFFVQCWSYFSQRLTFWSVAPFKQSEIWWITIFFCSKTYNSSKKLLGKSIPKNDNFVSLYLPSCHSKPKIIWK